MSGALRGLTARELGRTVLYLPEVDSTNRYLKQRGGELPHGTVCYTGRQTAGRGRLGRLPRQGRPVYVGGAPLSGTSRRSGEGEFRCTPDEVRRMSRRAGRPLP